MFSFFKEHCYEYRVMKQFLQEKSVNGTIYEEIESDGIIHIPFKLPPFTTKDDLLKANIIQKLETMTKKKINIQEDGRLLLFSFVSSNRFEGTRYIKKYQDQPLILPLHSPIEDIYINFHDDSNTHMLIGGASRMGKTKALQYLILHLFLQCKHHKHDVHFFVATAKPNDFKVFKSIQEITAISDDKQTLQMLNDVLTIATERCKVLDEYKFIKDAKDLRREHPHKSFTSIFVIIDEFARYSDNKEIRKRIEEIAETCGYLDIHLVLASQRPDSKDVLSPRVTANLLTCMAFTTKNKANSNIILGVDGAEQLGGIPGKALLLDGPTVKEVFIPYVGDEEKDIYPLIKKWDGVFHAKRKFNIEYARCVSSHEQGANTEVNNQRATASKEYNESNTVKISRKTEDKKGGNRKKWPEPLRTQK